MTERTAWAMLADGTWGWGDGTLTMQVALSDTAEQTAPSFSKAAYAYEVVRRKILDGAYQPGDRLRLAELARELNLSEMPVREALRLLQKDGLVVMRLHRGAEVARLSFERGLEVTEARMRLERAAALAAMPHHDAASVAGLQVGLLALEDAASRPVAFALQNRAFSTSLSAPCPNTFMRQLIEELWDQVWQASSTSVFDLMRHRVQETIDESRAIVQHVQERDARRLGAVMDARLRATMRAWRGAIASHRGNDRTGDER